LSWKKDPGRQVIEQLMWERGGSTSGKSAAGKKSGGSKGSKTSRPATVSITVSQRLQMAAGGFILGMLGWIGASQLGLSTLPKFGDFDRMIIAGAIAAVVASTRLRPVLWISTGLCCVLILVVGYTPLVVRPTQALVRNDTLRPADAVVVLSSSVRKSGEMDDPFQNRVLHGYEVLRQGFAPRLVVTHLAPISKRKSYIPAIREQFRHLQFDYPIEEVGPVDNTYDEARLVAQLLKEKGWKRVILVSDPTHLRRAAATFKKAGVPVLCSPCRNPEYDITRIKDPGERLKACRDLFHETIGYETYRLQGRL
jgi:uncharacterized SAM-binding protein YcdF (DUF218 family)